MNTINLLKYQNVHKVCMIFKNSKAVPGKLHFLQSYKGGYGEGDDALGINVPTSRKIAKQFRLLPLPETQKLLKSRFHEERLIGIFILINQYNQALKDRNHKEIKKIYALFWKNKDGVNNWDLVDSLAPYLTGHFYFHFDKKDLVKLIKSKNLWQRRIAVVSMFYFIRNQKCEYAIDVICKRLYDKEDLIHKACGWMLREAGKRNKELLIGFLNQHAGRMPRTALRYSIEKLSVKEKKYFMGLKR